MKFTTLLFLILSTSLFAQKTVRSLPAKRTLQKVVIDGVLNEPAWADAAKMDSLVEFRPKMGRREEAGNHTEAYLMYTDDGIYFGGTCFERSMDSVSKELVGRDGFGMNDYIGLIFDTYNDKLNGFEYFLTPLGEQWDAKMSSVQNSNNGGEDFAWNAVWQSKVVMHNKGWTFEMFLPYSAIRFSKEKVQNWGINITRRKRKTEQQYTWNPIDVNVNGFLTQEGQWTGITDIKPPVRLQLYPYFSVYENHYPSHEAGVSNWSSQVSGGLDLKLGLSQAFTLDATLIPDFGQVQSDNKVLNLTPFEVKYNENRTFFTEGTELFDKGNLFYSRRIGGSPIYLDKVYDDLKDNETLINNPSVSKLINASKISGRTTSGLGIGLMNAITKTQYATIKNEETGETRSYVTDPATNYNILVLDQNLKHNSSITLFNSSVVRQGSAYDANVSAGMWSLFDKKNTYNFSGKIAFSKINDNLENPLGYSHTIGISKNSGRFYFDLNQELTDTKFTSNDLGYFTNNNFITNQFLIGNRHTTPKGWYNRLNYNLQTTYSTLFSPIGDITTKYQRAQFQAQLNAQTKKLAWFGIVTDFSPAQNDFYEPRSDGSFYKRGKSSLLGVWYQGNSAKKYSIYAETFVRKYWNFYNILAVDNNFMQTYRFNAKFSVVHEINYNPRPKSVGYTTTLDDGTIIFAGRKISTTENIITLKYNFTNKMGLTLRTRHYASMVKNKSFYKLENNGLLSPTTLEDPHHRNVNYFNVDMVYTWQIAPGSFLNVVWKDAAVTSENVVGIKYGDNLGNILRNSHNNNFSMKIIYFIDYLNIKSWIKKA